MGARVRECVILRFAKKDVSVKRFGKVRIILARHNF